MEAGSPQPYTSQTCHNTQCIIQNFGNHVKDMVHNDFNGIASHSTLSVTFDVWVHIVYHSILLITVVRHHRHNRKLPIVKTNAGTLTTKENILKEQIHKELF